MNRAISSSKESVAPLEELENWKESVLLPTLLRYSPNDIYNGDETSVYPIELIVLMVTSPQALPNVKTDLHCL